MSCRSPIDFETLTAYWLGELLEQREAMIEEHLFGCAHCTRRLEGLGALAEGIRAVVHNGQVSMVVSAGFVDAMKRSGLRLREYRLEPGDSVNCTIRAGDDAVVSRLNAPLAGIERLDITSVLGEAEPELRFTDVPFDEQAGEVVVIPSASWLKTMPAFTMRMRLIAVADGGEKRIGEYTFNHVPS